MKFIVNQEEVSVYVDDYFPWDP